MYLLIMLRVYHRMLVRRKESMKIQSMKIFSLVNVYDDERKIHVLELCFSLPVVSIRMSRTRFDSFIREILLFQSI